ncbi:MAG TPA: hypothetical protein PK110_14875 [Niabella sp.]|nr:hypothetical protein [Niabella sp.]
MPEKFTKRKIPTVMFANCGHGQTRRLDDSAALNFISAGQGQDDGVRPFYFSNQIRNLIIGDILAIYRNKVGYVGIARVISRPMTISQAFLARQQVVPEMFIVQPTNMFRNANNPGYAECLVEIKWLTNVHLREGEGSGACFGIYAKPHVVCSLDNQLFLKQQLEAAFHLKFDDLLNN